jgi:hypothetical protein
MVVVPARQAGNRFLGSLKGLQIRALQDLYSGINAATLTGAIDVIAVEQRDGSVRFSPFHVRYYTVNKFSDIPENGNVANLFLRCTMCHVIHPLVPVIFLFKLLLIKLFACPLPLLLKKSTWFNIRGYG